jgi:hypothetical protein
MRAIISPTSAQADLIKRYTMYDVSRSKVRPRKLIVEAPMSLTGIMPMSNVFAKVAYGWIPHNASFGFLDLAPSILHSNWFWDYIS